MSDTTTEGAETTTTDSGEQQEQKGLTQADVDRIVKDRIARVEAKYADYNDLKKAADGAKTVEQKLADLESKYAEAEARALRSDIAARHGIAAGDRDLFLTGSDEATLEAQAKRLAEREADRKKNGNIARKEGGTTTTGSADSEARTFVSQLFGGSD